MKKFLALFLALIMCLGVLAGCFDTSEENGGATLEQAKDYLSSSMKEYNGRATMNDYDVVGKVIVEGVTFEVTWKTNNDKITVKESTKTNFWTIDLPDFNEKEVEYKLIATIKAADGTTVDVEFTPKLPVLDNRGVSTTLSEDVAYKIYFEQVNLGYTLYALNTTQENNNKFINSTLDPKEAADFYVEVVDNGYKVYTMIDNVKYYLHATATPKETGNGYTKAIGFATTTDCVFVYDDAISTYTVKIGSETFGVGTYNAFETISISEKSYFTAAKINVEEGQFPIGFMTSEYAETLTPDEKPVVNDPAADSTLTIAEAIALGETKVKDQYTSGKYYVKGTIKEVQNDVYGNLVITDGTNDILVYGTFNATGDTKYGEMENAPVVGDTITVYGIVGMYNAAQIKNAWIVEVQKAACTEHTYDNACDADCNVCGETREPAAHVYDNDCDATCNVCEAEREPAEHIYDNACDAKCNECEAERTPEAHVDANEDAKCDVCGASVNAETIEKGRIDAEVAALEFKDIHVSGEYTLPAKGAQYDNVTITWTAEGATIANGKVTLSNATASDVTVTLKATFVCGSTTVEKTYTFKVTAHQYTNKCDESCNVEGCTETRTVAHNVDANSDGKCDNCGEEIKTYDNPVSIEKALEIAGQQADNEYTKEKYTITGVIKEIKDTTYGNLYLKDAEGNEIYVYGVYSVDGSKKFGEFESMPKVGDTITITGVLGKYKTDIQMKSGWIAHYHEFADATCTAPETCTICKATKGEALGHKFESGVCTVCGVDENAIPKALTELKNGDVVAIVAPAYNKAFSATKTGYYNVGIDISSGISGLTDAEKFTVTVNADGSYTFTSLTGDVIALADEYSSFNVDGANKSWALEAKNGATGIFYLKNTVRGNYIEWYAEKNNWSSYATSNLSDLFELSFYKVG